MTDAEDVYGYLSSAPDGDTVAGGCHACGWRGRYRSMVIDALSDIAAHMVEAAHPTPTAPVAVGLCTVVMREDLREDLLQWLATIGHHLSLVEGNIWAVVADVDPQ